MQNEITKIYEDDNLLIINKPYGLIVHKKNATDTQPALTDWVIANYPDLENVGEPFIASGTPVPRCGIVHRLDKETSGLIIIAKNQVPFDYFKNLFQTHAMEKHYYALVYGHLKEASGIIDAPLGRIGMKRTTRIEGKKMIDGKESVTEYKVVKRFDKYTLLNITPKTGRTHQIRVHFKSISHPIVGDMVYAPKGWGLPEGLSRLFLHAYKLRFQAPDGKSLNVEIDLPDDLQKVLSQL